MKSIVAASLLLICSLSYGGMLYKCTDMKGDVTYSALYGAGCVLLVGEMPDPLPPKPGDNLDRKRWFAIAGGNNGAVYFVDAKTVIRSKPVRSAWIVTSYPSSQKPDGYSVEGYQSTKEQWIFNCQDRSIATLQVIRYNKMDAQGNIVFSRSIDKSKAVLDSVAPETIGEVILEAICK